ncbi:hypothetical protein [Bradyrhizobium sp. MOS003]|uniref:hypothetical protein n=1 Tax=Bradyrhizobium sp. MOS003 TaxID=2133946 RepID=UPI000D138E78|nr:hypothetical protein [Bradyrhizobium sp. MOS003]PSO19140.1 hypothetical protein C7G42_12625 [Bradyrhizobium sp. MOS003]
MSTQFTYTRKATPAEAAAIRAKRAKRNALTNEGRAAISAAVAQQIGALPKATDGAPGIDGDNGWSPVLAIVEDGERRVVAVARWVGGDGPPPDTGFIGPDGILNDIAGATDVRGSPGARGKIGADGKDGAVIFTETRNPKVNEGAEGDCWLNSKSGDFFRKEKGAWKLKSKLRGPRGFAGVSGRDGGNTVIQPGGDGGSSILFGSGPPPSGGVVGQEILVGSGPPT